MDIFEDDYLVSLFISDNYDDFEEYCRDRGISHDFYCDYEFDYVLTREAEFIEYAALVREENAQDYTGDEGFYE